MIHDKLERVRQIYRWYKTARLNVLYYEESLKNWTMAVRVHDSIIAISGVSSPIAFWQHSSQPLLKQAWFYITLFACFSSVLKPVFRWEKKLTLFSELHSHYCDLFLELKCLCEDIAADKDLDPKANAHFERCRTIFRNLEQKEPPQDNKKVKRLQVEVNRQIDINKLWFPESE